MLRLSSICRMGVKSQRLVACYHDHDVNGVGDSAEISHFEWPDTWLTDNGHLHVGVSDH
jgi:hypothetical protein